MLCLWIPVVVSSESVSLTLPVEGRPLLHDTLTPSSTCEKGPDTDELKERLCLLWYHSHLCVPTRLRTSYHQVISRHILRRLVVSRPCGSRQWMSETLEVVRRVAGVLSERKTLHHRYQQGCNTSSPLLIYSSLMHPRYRHRMSIDNDDYFTLTKDRDHLVG